jgi:hypothetical protein
LTASLAAYRYVVLRFLVAAAASISGVTAVLLVSRGGRR